MNKLLARKQEILWPIFTLVIWWSFFTFAFWLPSLDKLIPGVAALCVMTLCVGFLTGIYGLIKTMEAWELI